MSAARSLLLIGGGHAHALVLAMMARRRMPGGWQVTLASDADQAPYSGLLPGHIAGQYSREAMHIELPPLCRRAGAAFKAMRICGIDPEKRIAFGEGGEALPFDLCSVNVGSTPAPDAPGAAEFTIPAKPVPALLAGWDRVRAAAAGAAQRIAVIGGGAGGVELALCVKARLGERAGVVLLHGGRDLLPGHGSRAGRIALRLLRDRGISVRLGDRVVRVEPDRATGESGAATGFDFAIWATGSAAPAWIGQSGLTTDGRGFLAVAPTLESLSHPGIFAAGDCATIVREPRPKCGVFAVRAARPLFRNLLRAAAGKPLAPHDPQQHFLSLIGTGDGSALATRAGWAAAAPLLWTLKDRIDRRFMRRFA